MIPFLDTLVDNVEGRLGAADMSHELVELTLCWVVDRIRPAHRRITPSARLLSEIKLVRFDLIQSTSRSAVHSRTGYDCINWTPGFCRSLYLGIHHGKLSRNFTMSIIGLLKLVKDAR
ncbi:hypothetical protein H9P43_009046 [Blastocladiella emersonii ATCC 22665]|nr:hypothetical protein H9P43_009046 [Blastocladiella emersonii ATCC 22665]